MPGCFLRLSRHGSFFYFRRRVPADLVGILRQQFIVKSLRTSDRKQAVARARIMAVQTDLLFSKARDMKYSFDPSFSSGLVIDITAPNGTKIRLDGSVEELESAAVTKLIDALDLAAPVEAKTLTGNANTDKRVVSPGAGQVVQEGIAEVDPASRGPRGYRAAYEMYMAEADHKPTTKRTYKSRLEFAESFFGEKLGERSVVSIDQPLVYEYAKFVKSKVPNPRTASLYLTTLAGMLNWFRQRYTSNFVAITTQSFLSKDQIKPAADERDPFELDEIKALFSNAKQYRVQCPHKYWVTVAVPFLGCRIEELAQLELPADLKHDAGSNIWYISLNEHPDRDGVVRKSLKKLSSWRVVPIHSALVEHGFVKFLKSQIGVKGQGLRTRIE